MRHQRKQIDSFKDLLSTTSALDGDGVDHENGTNFADDESLRKVLYGNDHQAVIGLERQHGLGAEQPRLTAESVHISNPLAEPILHGSARASPALRKSIPPCTHSSPLVNTDEQARLLGLTKRHLEVYRLKGGGPPFSYLGTGKTCVRYCPECSFQWARQRQRHSTSE